MNYIKNQKTDIVTDPPYKHKGGPIFFQASGLFDGANLQIKCRSLGSDEYKSIDNGNITSPDFIEASLSYGSEVIVEITGSGQATNITFTIT